MITRKNFLELLGGLAFSAPSPTQPLAKTGRITMLLSDSNWTVAPLEPGQGITVGAYEERYSPEQAVPATVPGDVHWDLERAGKLPNIFEGLNSRKIRTVPRKEWWYRKKFVLPADWQASSVRLCFDGADYAAQVWLNGRSLGRHEGQFTPFWFDVSGLVRPGGENVLAVLIEAPPPNLLDALFSQSGSGIGQQNAQDEITKTLRYWKSRMVTGWDFGTPVWTMGIWQDVRLIGANGVFLSELTVRPALNAPYDRAQLHLQVQVDSELSQHITLLWEASCLTASAPQMQSSRELDVPAGGCRVRHETELKRPLLWWPSGYGRQHLYQLTVTALDNRRDRVLDRTSVTFGIRDLQILENPGADDYREYHDYGPLDQNPLGPYGGPWRKKIQFSKTPRRYLISINGERLFARGGNWTPCDLLFGRARAESYEHLIRLAAMGNYNFFRIWGGGLIEKQVFYDLCDRYGIMVWQEMPHAGRRPLETDDRLAAEAEQLRQVLPLLANHPCVVRYGFGNELYLKRENSRQLAQFKDLCRRLDPDRPVYGPDPVTSAQRHGPHWFFFEEAYALYNTGHPLTAGPDNPIEWTEYGAAGASSVATLAKIIPSERLWPIRHQDPYWQWHKASEAYGKDRWLSPQNYRLLFGDLPDLETEVRCSQWAQAEGVRYANQTHRRNKWHRSGCATWSYNEPWPNAAHPCVVEHYGSPKMAYYYSKSSYSPVDVSAVYDSITCLAGVPLPAQLWITSDLAVRLPECQLRVRFLSLDGHLLARHSFVFDVEPKQSRALPTPEFIVPTALVGHILLLRLDLQKTNGQVLSSQTYTFGVVKTEEEVGAIPAGALSHLLRAPLAETGLVVLPTQPRKLGGESLQAFQVSVRNKGPAPALFVKLEISPAEGTRHYFEDNYFTLLAGEPKEIEALVSPPRSPPARSLRLVAQAWNSRRMAAPIEFAFPQEDKRESRRQD